MYSGSRFFEVLLQTAVIEHGLFDEVGDDEDDAFGVTLHDDDAIADAGKFADGVLDFAQLDAKATNLHLMIFTAKIFDIPIRQPTGDVAGAVDAFAGTNRIVGEFLGGQRGVVEIAARQADACEAKFAGLADWRGAVRL